MPMRRIVITLALFSLASPVVSQAAGMDDAPIGTVLLYAGDTLPSGWLLCDGSVLDGGTYPELVGVLGTRYGANGQLPDIVDRVVRAAMDLVATVGDIGGTVSHNLNHAHNAGSLAGPSHNHGAGSLGQPTHTHGVGSLANASHSHNQMLGGGGTSSGALVGLASSASGSNVVTGASGAGSLSVVQTGTENASSSISGSTGSGGGDAISGSTDSSGTGSVTGQTSSFGTTTADNWPPYIRLPFIIKAQNANTVPTAAEWGLIGLTMVLAMGGFVALTRRSAVLA